MQSSVNTPFSRNTCVGGHGISIGSLAGDVVDVPDTVSGLTVANDTITNSDNGIRIKHTNNVLNNVKKAIVIHSDALTNPNVVSNWTWTCIGVTAKTEESCMGKPSTVTCV